MNDVFFKGSNSITKSKKPVDKKAYEFLNGFFDGIENEVAVDDQALYNQINGKGIMVFGPVESAMKILWQKVNSTDNQEQHLRHFWMAIHEVQHIFLEGGEILVSAGVLDRAGVEKVR